MIHPRTAKVQKAKLAISEAFWNELPKHDLTFLEAIYCVEDLLSSLLKHGLRAERHPQDPDKGADEA